jgi:hypothetical protein
MRIALIVFCWLCAVLLFELSLHAERDEEREWKKNHSHFGNGGSKH